MATRKEYVSGGELLTRMPAVTLTLEDGSTHEFRWTKELRVPDSLLEQRRMYQLIPSQVAFWAYQTERALREVRELEKALSHKEGEMNLIYRRFYVEKNEEYTEGQIRARVDTDGQVATARDELNAARGMYATLRALKDAVEHRAYVLRQLISNPSGPSA